MNCTHLRRWPREGREPSQRGGGCFGARSRPKGGCKRAQLSPDEGAIAARGGPQFGSLSLITGNSFGRGVATSLKWTAFVPKGTVPIATPPSPDTPGGRDHFRGPPSVRTYPKTMKAFCGLKMWRHQRICSGVACGTQPHVCFCYSAM